MSAPRWLGTRWTFLLRVLWIAGMAAFLGLLIYTLKRAIDPVANDRYARDIRAIEALDAQLDSQVMLSRQSLVNQYDDIVHTVDSLEILHRRLREVPKYLGESERAELKTAVEQSAAEVAGKEARIETFKSENAVLRNSVRFFPVAALELRDKLQDKPDNQPIARAVNELLCSVLRFNTQPGDALREKVTKALATIGSSTPPDEDKEDVDIVVAHASTVLARRDKVDDLTNDIVSIPTRARIEHVDAVYAKAFLAALRASAQRSVALFVLALTVLLLVATDIIVHLRRVARASRQTSDELAIANTALKREKERERELGDLKSRFVSMASHEFRTPLSVILSSAELLEAYSDRWTLAKQSDHYSRIKVAVSGMTELLDEVLVIGRADVDKLDCKPARLDLARCSRELCDIVLPALSPKHTLEVSIADDFGDAFVDVKLLNHILTNLLSNAVKYSPNGGKIGFEAKREGDEVCFVVSDEGIGIREVDLDRLFESFHRGGNVGTIQGTGLGLAVVKRSVDAHGGSMTVTSTEGEGTTVSVRLYVGEHPRTQVVTRGNEATNDIATTA